LAATEKKALEEARTAELAQQKAKKQKAREEAIDRKAAEQKARQEKALAAAEAKKVAAAELARQREAERKAALRERETTLQKAREQAEVWRQGAQVTLRKNVEAVKQDLQAACRSLAQEIMVLVLDTAASSEGKRGA
jgi:colicin import membrane protein